MKLVEIQQHLASLQIFDRVEAVMSEEEINKQLIRKPVAYIAPAGTGAQQNERSMGQALQLLNETYSVIYCIPSLNDKTGMKGAEKLQEIITTTRRELISFAPENAELMTFEGGQLMVIGGGFILWHDQFSTQYHLEGNKI